MGSSAKGGRSNGPSAVASGPAAASGDGAATRKRLGRGLSSLLNQTVAVRIPEAQTQAVPVATPAPMPAPASADSRERIEAIPVAAVVPSPFQPRRTFDQGALERLAASIRTAGVMQPILVRRAGGSGGGFELIAGERRWRAAQLAGLSTVPAIIADLGDEQAAEWALIENVQREELGAMERAFALRSLAERFSLTHAQVAEKVGLDRSSVTNLIRLTELEEPIRDLIDGRKLTVGHGKALLGVPPGPARIALAERAAGGGWSVRRLEHAAAAAANAATTSVDSDPERSEKERARALGVADLERQLGEYLGTKVKIRASRDGSRGRITLEFYDLDHFDGLMARMGFQVK